MVAGAALDLRRGIRAQSRASRAISFRREIGALESLEARSPPPPSMPPRKRARAAASTASMACDRSAILLKQSAAISSRLRGRRALRRRGEARTADLQGFADGARAASPSSRRRSAARCASAQQAVTLDASLSATAVEALLKFAHAALGARSPCPRTGGGPDRRGRYAEYRRRRPTDREPARHVGHAREFLPGPPRSLRAVRPRRAGEGGAPPIDTHFAELAASDAFRQLPVEAVTRLLKADEMEMTEETASTRPPSLSQAPRRLPRRRLEISSSSCGFRIATATRTSYRW